MGPDAILSLAVLFGQHLHFQQRVDDLPARQFVPQFAVESLHVSDLPAELLTLLVLAPVDLLTIPYPEVISLLVKLSISREVIQPHPGLVQPSPPEVPDEEARYRIHLVGRLGPGASADAGAACAPDTVLEGHALLRINLPR